MTAPSDTQQTTGESGLVSVVIIFLDEERFLGEAVASVVAQDYPRWELLLVDDGSTDRSTAMAQAFAEADPRIRYLCHPDKANRGMSASRNLGLANARGEFVAFLDADDVYLPGRLRHHVDVLNAMPAVAMTVSDHIRWFHDGAGSAGADAPSYRRPRFALGDQLWHPPLGLMVVMAVPYLGLGICNVTVRRRVAEAVGGFEDAFTSQFEDQAFTSKVLARYPVYVLQRYLARYRHHAGSWTRRAKASGSVSRKVPHDDLQRFIDWLRRYLDAEGIDDPLLLELIARRRAGAGSPPGPVRRALIRASAAVQRLLRALLPDAWYVRLLVADYERDRRRARRQYDALAERLSR
jgi:glycosyltransferase involved in cell wall biosynthesis